MSTKARNDSGVCSRAIGRSIGRIMVAHDAKSCVRSGRICSPSSPRCLVRRRAASLFICIALAFSLPLSGFFGGAVAQATAAASERVLLAPDAGEISIRSVSSSYTLIALDQRGIPLAVVVRNDCPAAILIESVLPAFTRSTYNDRFADYNVVSGMTVSLILMPGEAHTFDFVIDVNTTALTGANIRIDASVSGHRIDTNAPVSASTAVAPHYWLVTSELINALAAVYETRTTPIRSDDSLVAYIRPEGFPFNMVHNMNGGAPIADLVMNGSKYYRIVVQINASYDWDFDPNATGHGYFALSGASRCLGKESGETPGIKQLLLTDFFVTNEGNDPTDIVVGMTKSTSPATPWTMYSNPWTDGALETGSTAETGTFRVIGPSNTTIDCFEGGNDWELRDDCEHRRYFFYEMWLRPDLDWANGDTADVYLHISGNPGTKDLKELHMRFRIVDDDSLPPSFSEFAPGIVPADSSFYITCKITDPSGVFDDGTGSGGQGVYLLWDDDGSLADGAHEITMSSIGAGYYRSDLPIGPHGTGDALMYQVHACDNDFDGGKTGDRSCAFSAQHAVQIVGSTYLVDQPGSLQPKSVYPGQEHVAIHLEFNNPMTQDIALNRTSFVAFSQGTDTVKALLRNDTVIPAGATDFPVAFNPVTIPLGFSAPDTASLILDLAGTYMAMQYHQAWTASEANRLVILKPRLRFEAFAVPSNAVHPGDASVELLQFKVTNDSPADLSVDSLVVSNATIGAGGVPQTDANFGSLHLYRQASGPAEIARMSGMDRVAPARAARAKTGDEGAPGSEGAAGRSMSAADSLVDQGRFAGGRAKFRLASGSPIHPGQYIYYYVTADVDSFLACDGDSLDVEVSSPDSVFVGGSVPCEFARTPLNSATKSVVDGFMTFQIAVEKAVPDTLYRGDKNQLLLSFVLPPNGYAPDILSLVSVRNFDASGADSLIEKLALWKDNGDGAFSPGADSLVGELKATGNRWALSGIQLMIRARQRFFVSADFELGTKATLGARFGIPAGGIEFVSGDDGPIDGNVVPSASQVLIRREIVSLAALPVPAVVRYPGDAAVELLALQIRNNTLDTVRVDSLRLRGISDLFACEPQKPVTLHADNGDSQFDPGADPAIATSHWSGGSALFAGVGLSIPSGSQKILFAAVTLDSALTVDGETLLVGLESQGDIHLSLGPASNEAFYRLDAAFPLFSAGGAVTDGMLARQVAIYSHGDSAIVEQKKNVLVLDIHIPGNSCVGDTLKSLKVTNLGTAGPSVIDGFVLWRDNGDGAFSAVHDDSLAAFSAQGAGTYMASGLSEPVPGPSGARFFVTMNVHESIQTGGTVRMAIPLMGIQVASGNDGPLDQTIVSPGVILIPVPDRVTFFTSMVGNKRVQPGEKHVINLALGMFNSYQDSKILQRLALLNVGSSQSSEIVKVEAYADTDEDGLFNPAVDSLLETAQSSGALYVFDNLNLTLRSYRSTLVFVTYDAALQGIRDSVRIDLQVSDRTSLGFQDNNVNMQGEFPLNSAGVDVTDGMVSAQVRLLPVADALVSPGAHDVPCFSFVLPCDGVMEDVLEGLSVQNAGTAEESRDIQVLKLWKDTGSKPLSFDPADEVLAYLAWNGGAWRTVSRLSEAVLCEGLVLHVTADIASTARNGKDIRLCVPLNGVSVASGNDGPIDRNVCGPAVISITTDPLFVSFVTPAAVTKDQVFEVRLNAANVSDTTLRAVVPDSFTIVGTGGLTLLSGPQPASIDLASMSDSAFIWTFRAQSTGELVFHARAKETSGRGASIVVRSDTLLIDEIPTAVTVAMKDLAPVSLNRGQEDASMMEMTIGYHPASGRGAPLTFASMEVSFSDESGSPLPVRNAASRIRLKDEWQVLCSVQTDTISLGAVTLTLPGSVTLRPGDSKVFRLSLDVPLSAAAQRFRISIQSPGKLVIADGNSGAPVPFTGTTFPWSTNTVALNDPANALTMSLTPRLPARVNKGQDNVVAFAIVLANSGPASTAPVSVSELVFTMRDAAGDSVDAGRVLRVFRLDGAGGNTYASVESFNGSARIRCVLQPPVTVSSQVPVALTAVAGCLLEPSVTGFSVSLDDSTDVAARDVNSGRPVRVTASAPGFPLSSGTAAFRTPLRSVDVAGNGLLVERIMAGSVGVPVLRLRLRHPGTAGESPFSCAGVTVRVLDEAGRALDPNPFLDVVRVRLNGVDFASAYVTAGTGSDISIDFSSPLLVEPGGVDTLDVLVDLDAAPSPSRFQMQVNPAGLRITDATDGRSAINITGAFPVTSGIGRIIFPAAQVLFDADGLLPANVAVGEENDCMRFRFVRQNDSSGSRVFFERIVLDVLGEDDRAIDPSRVIEALRLDGASGEIASSWAVEGGRLVVTIRDTVAIGENETRELVLRIATVAAPDVKMFSLRVAGPSDVVCRDEATGGATGVVAGSGAFPYGSGRAALLARDIEASFSNYPNPFVAGTEKTTITFYMPVEGLASLRVFTVTGEPVRTIVDRAQLKVGLHQEFSWDGRNGAGNAVLNGVYYLLLKVDSGSKDYTLKRKVALVR